jgi:factor associated with neutral sphingomyelinase activation
MYMSHYSTPGIVFYYLIRRFPSYLTRIQNDEFGGPPDRIFFDVGLTWQNCLKVLSDNKELIPEFYLDSNFLQNTFEADLGENHLGRKVTDVSLPPWASSPLDFTLKMRAALESNHVTTHLPKWIDLVFGHLQLGYRA